MLGSKDVGGRIDLKKPAGRGPQHYAWPMTCRHSASRRGRRPRPSQGPATHVPRLLRRSCSSRRRASYIGGGGVASRTSACVAAFLPPSSSGSVAHQEERDGCWSSTMDLSTDTIREREGRKATQMGSSWSSPSHPPPIRCLPKVVHHSPWIKYKISLQIKP